MFKEKFHEAGASSEGEDLSREGGVEGEEKRLGRGENI